MWISSHAKILRVFSADKLYQDQKDEVEADAKGFDNLGQVTSYVRGQGFNDFKVHAYAGSRRDAYRIMMDVTLATGRYRLFVHNYTLHYEGRMEEIS